jgi:hypothetical protein
MSIPPFGTSTCPTKKQESSEAKNSAVAATSAGKPNRTALVEVPLPSSRTLEQCWAHFMKQVYEVDPLLSPLRAIVNEIYLNATIQWVKKTARGFRNVEHFKTAIYFHCGGLDLYPHKSR